MQVDPVVFEHLEDFGSDYLEELRTHLTAEIMDIDVQLSDKGMGPDGWKQDFKDYLTWRRSAIHAKTKMVQQLQQVKAEIKHRNQEKSREATDNFWRLQAQDLYSAIVTEDMAIILEAASDYEAATAKKERV